jgi:phospholipase/carboxylesterase
MPLDTLDIDNGPDPRAVMIILHGLGADGHDFEPLADELELSAVGAVRFVMPHAPSRPVTINGGYVMPAWYDILALGGRGAEDEAGLRQAQGWIEEVIAREVERGLPASRIVLAGFSQGCAMALMTGLRHPERLAGIVGLSGYLPLAASTAAERHPANADVPIFLAHGRYDPIVAIERGTASRGVLTDLGYPVEWHDYPMEHSLCADEVADLTLWLRKVLA